MPDLDYAILCDYVREDQTGGVQHIIAAGIDTVHVAEVPTGVNFGVALRVMFTRSECDRPHRLELIVQDEDGERLATVDGHVVPTWPGPDHPAHWKVGTAAALNLGVVVPRFGVYAIDVLMNDTELRSLPFRVKQGGQPDVQQHDG